VRAVIAFTVGNDAASIVNAGQRFLSDQSQMGGAERPDLRRPREFVEIYGYDVTESPSWPILRRVRELRMTAWLAQKAAESPQIADELVHRAQCLQDESLPRKWSRN
jgi:hypothetical protein